MSTAELTDNHKQLVEQVAKWQTHRDRATHARDQALEALDRATIVADAVRQGDAQRVAADFAVISRSLTEDIDRAIGHLEGSGLTRDAIGEALNSAHGE